MDCLHHSKIYCVRQEDNAFKNEQHGVNRPHAERHVLEYTNSAKMISSTWALRQFISPTQRMGSRAFSFSAAPASSAIPGIILSSRAWTASSTSSRWAYRLPSITSSVQTMGRRSFVNVDSSRNKISYWRDSFISRYMTAFWAWRRFSASSKISLAWASKTSAVISSPRWAGRQCCTMQPALVRAISSLLIW